MNIYEDVCRETRRKFADRESPTFKLARDLGYADAATASIADWCDVAVRAYVRGAFRFWLHGVVVGFLFGAAVVAASVAVWIRW